MQYKVKLAAIAKNEAAYIPQWIFHHLSFGFDCIEIWINDTTDNSAELIEKISNNHETGKVVFTEADELLKDCISNGLNFQIEAYSKIFNKTKNTEDYTHILFLDLDEFWIPSDFTKSIKDIIANKEYEGADAISFQWMIDAPDLARNEFDRPLKATNLLRKDRHVKTLIKISHKKTKVLVHNSQIENGEFYLSSGIPFLETDPDQHHRSKVPKDYFEETSTQIDESFILHLIHKSQAEYLASLTRGRSHANDNNIFKTNRFGYLPKPENTYINFLVQEEKIQKHEKNFQEFIRQNDISSHLKTAQLFVYSKFHEALDKLSNNPSLLDQYKQQLQGLKIKDLSNYRIKSNTATYYIDIIKLTGNTIDILGWVFDPFSRDPITLEVTLNTKEEKSIIISKKNRPDVINIYPDANLDCGFKIEIILSSKDIAPLTRDELPFKIHAKNNNLYLELKTKKKITINQN
ncbi:glycosyltransferase family 2 protein [Azotobacter salinestris]|uniref:glycosyltransferase family 2 protein n=1 Tax=Azotobacter salinestris TaxID=69964 RepID=UPI0032DFD440